jgi:ATP-dependent Clp protease ATP-binding subunit ClpC
MEKHNLSRLIGAPPGYVGYEEGGQLTEKIRRRPYSVVLLDEIEKAHPDIFNTLLQVMEEGRLTDSFGRNIDFRNVILIMTTNVGAHAIKNESHFGLPGAGEDQSYEAMKERVQDEMNKAFRPEFLNRLSEMPIIFRHLTAKDMETVIDFELSKIKTRLAERGFDLVVTDDAKEFLIANGTDEDFGARPLRRALENYIENPLADELLQGNFQGKNKIIVDGVRSEKGKKKVKQLKFDSDWIEPPAPAPSEDEAVGVGAGDDNGSDDSNSDE